MDIKTGKKRLKEIFLNDPADKGLIRLDEEDIDKFLANSSEVSINTYTYGEVMSKQFKFPDFEVMGSLIMVEGNKETALNETVGVAGSVKDFIKNSIDNVMFAFTIVEGEGEPNIKRVHVAFADGRC